MDENLEFTNYKITKEYENVYYFLKENGFSENFITNLRKKEGYILINNNIANTKSKLKLKDVLSICNSPNQKTTIMHCIIPLDIVYEDKYYLLVNKPSNLSTMPNRSHYTNNLAGAICNYMEKENKNFVLRIINRLDKDTSGLILIAKNAIAQKDIKSFEKTYFAICEGVIKKQQTINLPILTLSNNNINERKRIISKDGKPATTIVTPLKHFKNYTLISAKLIQGRTHQIRLHLSSIGHPLLGDTLYGKSSPFITHTALVCKEISFFHPYKKKALTFSVPLPEDIKSLLN